MASVVKPLGAPLGGTSPRKLGVLADLNHGITLGQERLLIAISHSLSFS